MLPWQQQLRAKGVTMSVFFTVSFFKYISGASLKNIVLVFLIFLIQYFII